MGVHLIMKNNLQKFFLSLLNPRERFYLYRLKDHMYIFVIAKVLFYLYKF